jgi:hypothetical protein
LDITQIYIYIYIYIYLFIYLFIYFIYFIFIFILFFFSLLWHFASGNTPLLGPYPILPGTFAILVVVGLNFALAIRAEPLLNGPFVGSLARHTS